MKFTQEWISVKDHLPKETGSYLVNVHERWENDDTEVENNLVLKAWYNPTKPLFCPDEIGWTLMDEFYPYSDRIREHITHWTTWPKPIEEYDE